MIKHNNNDIIYSIGMPFNYSGIGNIAYYACKKLYDENRLNIILTPAYRKSDINNNKIKCFPFNPILGKLHNRIPDYYIKDSLFDNWASSKIVSGKFFYGWISHSLKSIEICKNKDISTYIDRGSIQIDAQKKLLEEAYKNEGLNICVISEKLLNRIRSEEKNTDYLVFPSDFIKNSYLEAGYPKNKLIVNPLGVNTTIFNKKSNYENDKFKVVFVGLIGIRKGVHLLLRAWQKLNLKNSELLLIGGFEKLSKNLLIKEINKTNNVKVIHNIVNPSYLYKDSDVFILPSIEDGFGMVVLEAMACGLPVIVTKNVGAKECIRENIDGLIINYSKVDEISDSILFFYKNRNLIKIFGENAHLQAQNYTWDKYQERYIKLFDENNLT